MITQEIALIKEFNRLKKQLEDEALEFVHDELYDYFDKVGNEKLQMIDKVAKDLIKTMDKIKDYNTILGIADEYLKNYKTVNQTFDEVMDYLNGNIEFENKIKEIMSLKLTPLGDKIENLIAGSYFYGYNRVANNMKFLFIKCKNDILDEIVKDPGNALTTYKKLICEIIDKVNNRIDSNLQKIQSYIEQAEKTENTEIEEKKLQKILDCRKMDKYLSEKGYIPTRQNGSHKIYNNGSNSIPVPQHSRLNKNLAFGIQKQMN